MAAKKKRAKGSVPEDAIADTTSEPEIDRDRHIPGENADLPPPAITVVVLQEENGSEPFTRWLNALRDREAKQRILARIAVVRRGSLGLMRPVGEGVSELKIDYATGYRLYFGRKGNTLVVLIVGGDKDSQVSDIVRAQELWKRYKDEIENV